MSHSTPASSSIRSTTPFWRDERVLRAFSQVVSAVLIIGFLILAGANLLSAAQQRGLSLGYDFLGESAGFPIGESVLPYDPAKSFGFAFGMGVLNTLKVALVGILLATILGTLVGLARLSDNWLLSRIALIYIELHRNIPLLVLLFLWYFAVFTGLPSVQEAITWPGPIYLSKRGLFMAWGELNPRGEIWIASLGLGIVLAVLAFFSLRKRREVTGRPTYFGGISMALLIGLPLAGWFICHVVKSLLMLRTRETKSDPPFPVRR